MGLEAPQHAPESNERAREELEKTRSLCATYHSVLDRTRYFDSLAISVAQSLKPQFEAIDLELLPNPVKLVIRHRLAYLNFIASLGASPAIGEFLDTVKERIGDLGLLLKNPQELYELVKNNEKFKALTPLDFRLILSGVHEGISALEQVNGANPSNWDEEADALLKSGGASGNSDSRIDDKTAAKNLEEGFGKLGEFALFVQMKKIREPRP